MSAGQGAHGPQLLITSIASEKSTDPLEDNIANAFTFVRHKVHVDIDGVEDHPPPF